MLHTRQSLTTRRATTPKRTLSLTKHSQTNLKKNQDKHRLINYSNLASHNFSIICLNPLSILPLCNKSTTFSLSDISSHPIDLHPLDFKSSLHQVILSQYRIQWTTSPTSPLFTVLANTLLSLFVPPSPHFNPQSHHTSSNHHYHSSLSFVINVHYCRFFMFPHSFPQKQVLVVLKPPLAIHSSPS